MKNKPIVSVVMPAYNCEAYIQESIESILNQTLSEFEFLIIDDASTDRTLAIIESYTDERIRLVKKNENTGYTDSLNMAIKLATGEYIARMDADDISLPKRLESQLKYLQENPDTLVVGCHYRVIGTDRIIRLPVTFDEAKIVALMHVPVAHPTVLIRREVFTKHNLWYNKDFEPAEDYDLWCRVIEKGKIENVDEVLLLYRHHDQQESRTKINKLLTVAVETRRTQLNKLVNWSNNNYELLTAIDILTKKSVCSKRSDLKKIRGLLIDLYTSNNRKRVYDKQLFLKFLRETWTYYTDIYPFSGIADFTLFFPKRPYGLTKIKYSLTSNLLFNLSGRFINFFRKKSNEFLKSSL